MVERPQGSEKVPWATASSVEALVEEVAGLQKVMERQVELHLEFGETVARESGKGTRKGARGGGDVLRKLILT